MQKAPIGCRFMVASKECNTKPLTKIVSYIFRMTFSDAENFHRKS